MWNQTPEERQTKGIIRKRWATGIEQATEVCLENEDWKNQMTGNFKARDMNEHTHACTAAAINSTVTALECRNQKQK